MNTSDKINQDFLKQYSSVFAEKLLKKAYENKQHLSGKDILNLSSVKQLNLFVIKAFFNEWQEEVKKLESPLFDYSSKEVRKSMIDFMNTLSQHISIEKVHLKPYVEEALMQTVLLASNVQLYLMEELAEKKSSRVSSKFIKSQLKYIVFHKEMLLDFFGSVEGESVREALNKSQLYFEDVDLSEVVDALISELSNYLVLDRSDLFTLSFRVEETAALEDDEDDLSEEEDEKEIELQASSSDYFGSFYKSEEKDSIEGDNEEEVQEIDEYEQSVPEEDSAIEKEEEQEEDDWRENDGQQTETQVTLEDVEDEDEAQEEDDEFYEGEDEEDESVPDHSVVEKFEVDKKTLAELHEEKKIESVFEAISINHRYMFLQELFDGDNELFTTALKDVDGCSTFDEAVEMLVQNYAKDFFWDMNSDEVKELLKVVYRKFRN